MKTMNVNRRGFLSFLGSSLGAAAVPGAAKVLNVTQASSVGAAASTAGLVAESKLIEFLRHFAGGDTASRLGDKVVRVGAHFFHLDQTPGVLASKLVLSDPSAQLEYARSLIPNYVWGLEHFFNSSPLCPRVLEVLAARVPHEARAIRQVKRLLPALQEAIRLSWGASGQQWSIRPELLNIKDPRAVVKYIREIRAWRRSDGVRRRELPFLKKLEKLFYRSNLDKIENRRYQENARSKWLTREILRRLKWTQYTRDRRRPKSERLYCSMLDCRQVVLGALSEHLNASRIWEVRACNSNVEECLRVLRRLDEQLSIGEAALAVVPKVDLVEEVVAKMADWDASKAFDDWTSKLFRKGE